MNANDSNAYNGHCQPLKKITTDISIDMEPELTTVVAVAEGMKAKYFNDGGTTTTKDGLVLSTTTNNITTTTKEDGLVLNFHDIRYQGMEGKDFDDTTTTKDGLVLSTTTNIITTTTNEDGLVLSFNDIRYQGMEGKDFDDTTTTKDNLVLSTSTNNITTTTKEDGLVLSFHDIRYQVRVRNPNGRLCSKLDREILHGVSGIFKPGMNGILGPTGSGKTSLLDILAGRCETSGLSGRVLVDGKLQPSNFKLTTGYVVQDDVLMGTLTIRENLMFSANLRLPGTVSKIGKEERVQATIDELGLTGCADSKVGTEFVRGISGGEKKRANIGMELITKPSIIFLDEPTTGLDASTANAGMKLLKSISLNNNRTVIFSIHQPRYSIYQLFDHLMLIGDGRVIYHGMANFALTYFNEIGYSCEEHNNPADFFLDVLNGDSEAVQHGSDEKNSSTGKINGGVKSPDGSQELHTLAAELTKYYLISNECKRLKEELDLIFTENNSKQTEIDKSKIEKKPEFNYTTSFVTQFKYLAGRCFRNLIRRPQTTFSQILMITCFSLVVGTLYFQVEDDSRTGLQNRVGAFFFIVMNQVFSSLSSTDLFIRERTNFNHESATGFYRVSSYFFSKVLCDIIPLGLIPVTIFCPIAYFMIGFQVDVGKFFIFFLTISCITLVSSSMGFAMSASVSITPIANLMLVFIFVIMMVFGGLFINLVSMPDWLSWIQYLSLFRYSLNVLNINELSDIVLYNYVNGTKYPNHHTGPDFLRVQGIHFEEGYDIWRNIGVMFIMMFIFLSLAYVQLRRLPKLK